MKKTDVELWIQGYLVLTDEPIELSDEIKAANQNMYDAVRMVDEVLMKTIKPDKPH